MPVLLLCLVVLLLSGPILWQLRPHRLHAFAWLAALPPALISVWLALQLPLINQGQQIVEIFPWAPTLNLELTLRLDGLSLFFGLIITGVGTCIAFYTNYYLEDEPRQGYFYLLLFLFMASMLGLVWADDLLSLFVFWEFTSISSYLLIAFNAGDKGATEGARHALIVTAVGGLALLTGSVLLGQYTGTYRISTILAEPGLAEAPIYPVVLALLLLGAFTKSAQFPFQFWLPGAMAAPTPASAYLHSATMVKAGVYLVARLQPGLGHSALWFWSLFLIGGITMVLGAVSAIRYTDMKAILTYTTISALGTMMLLLAFPDQPAVIALTVTIFAHALYKAPLFLTAGIVDHAMGSRDLQGLAGLWRILPLVTVVAVLAALSMAGVPPTWGFVSKELELENFFDLYEYGPAAIGSLGYLAVVVMALFSAGAIFTLLWEAFFRRHTPDAEPAHLHHAPSVWFVLPALLLAVAGAFTVLFTGLIEPLLLAPAAAILGHPIDIHLVLWHGWTPVFLTSLAILAASLLFVLARGAMRGAFRRVPVWFSGVTAYNRIVDAIYQGAYWVTRRVQGGPMGPQVSVTLLAGAGMLLYALLQTNLTQGMPLESYTAPSVYEILIFVVAIMAAVITVRARSRLSAIISLGIVGVAVTLFFVFYSAPDLALTQLLIEVLTVILLVLVFFRVKPDAYVPLRDRRTLFRVFVAGAMGFFGAGIVLVNHVAQVGPSISPYFLANSLSIGQGSNVVNVILVDIRGYDTMGEITVLGLAALGGYAVLRSPELHAVRRRINAAARGSGSRPNGHFPCNSPKRRLAMIEIYLRLVDLVLTPVIVLIAVNLFLRGHDLPGGGFIAGLTFAAAIELHILARGAEEARTRFGRYLIPLVGTGLLAAVSAALIGLYGGGFFKSIWLKFYVGGAEIKMGTPQLFDLGVMLVVIGMTITYLLRLSEITDNATPVDESSESEHL